MKIIFSTDQVYLHGGIEKVMAEKANYFADVCGYDVIILTCEQRAKKPCYHLSNKIRLVDLEINYERSISYFSFVNIKKVPLHLYRLRKFFLTEKADFVIVSSFGFDTYFIPFLYKKSKKIKEFHLSRHFESIERAKVNLGYKKIRFRINDWIESLYDNIVVLNQDEVRYYKSSNVVVIPNPISISNQAAALNNKKVIAAGRIAPIKGFHNLIIAWKAVYDVCPEWELHIYGEDYLNTQKDLEKLINENGLSQVIFFKGTSANMVQTFTDYSLYVMSSSTECFPMVLLESLSVGLPIVSFDCPNGPRNIINNKEDGLLVEDQNIGDLAKNILFLIQNKHERINFGVQAKANSFRFSTSIVMKQWTNLLFS